MNSNEVIDAETGEVIQQTALVPKSGVEALIKDSEKAVFRALENMQTLDWKSLPPPQMALLLTLKPFNTPGGGQMYLTFKQALLFAVRCFELGVSPFSPEVWFNANTSSVNLTLEGKRQVARNRGIDLGPPQFTDLFREWSDCPASKLRIEELQKLGFDKDIGIKCRMRVGDPKLNEHAEYSCWLSEWAVAKSPVWLSKPYHMLQTRATEKAISLAMGTGASDPVD